MKGHIKAIIDEILNSQEQKADMLGKMLEDGNIQKAFYLIGNMRDNTVIGEFTCNTSKDEDEQTECIAYFQYKDIDIRQKAIGYLREYCK